MESWNWKWWHARLSFFCEKVNFKNFLTLKREIVTGGEICTQPSNHFDEIDEALRKTLSKNFHKKHADERA